MTQPQYRQQGKQCGVEYLNDANSTSNLTSKTFLKLGDFLLRNEQCVDAFVDAIALNDDRQLAILTVDRTT